MCVLSKIKNLVGHLKGYGRCLHCGGTWNWKKGHDIPYYVDEFGYPGSFMFPLCEECFEELEADEIFEYCKKLWEDWGGKKGVDREEAFTNIREHIEEEKRL